MVSDRARPRTLRGTVGKGERRAQPIRHEDSQLQAGFRTGRGGKNGKNFDPARVLAGSGRAEYTRCGSGRSRTPQDHRRPSVVTEQHPQEEVRHRQLIREAKEGNQKAFGELWESFCEEIANLINRMGIGPDIRARVGNSDVASEVWLQAWRAIGTFAGEEGSEFRSWLLTIARHRLADLANAQRVGGRAPELEVPIGELEPTGRAPSPSTDSRGREARELIWKLLSRRPEVERTVFWETVIMGRSVAEVAEELRISAEELWAERRKARDYLRDHPELCRLLGDERAAGGGESHPGEGTADAHDAGR